MTLDNKATAAVFSKRVKMIVDGLYSYTHNGQVVKTVDVMGELGYMAGPGEDHNQEERGKNEF